MDERILARPERKGHWTRREWLDRLRLHLKEIQKLIAHWQDVGWNSKEQAAEYREYENALIQEVEALDAVLSQGAHK